MAGFFVTLEGIEGSGKTTQQRRLVEHLRAQGHDVVAAREPGGTALGEGARRILLEPRRAGASGPGVAPWAEAFLMLAARAQLVAEVLRPALAAGRVVVCDRYADSTLAYQGFGRGLDLGLLRRLNEAATGGLAPDLTLLLDLPVEAALARLEAGRPAAEISRFDQEDGAFHERVRAGFLELARGEPARFEVVRAGEPPDAIQHAIRDGLRTRLGRAGSSAGAPPGRGIPEPQP